MPSAWTFRTDMLSHADLRTTLYEKQERWASHAGKHPSIRCVRARRREVRQHGATKLPVDGQRCARRRHDRFAMLSVVDLHIYWLILFRYRAAAAHNHHGRCAKLRHFELPPSRRYVAANLRTFGDLTAPCGFGGSSFGWLPSLSRPDIAIRWPRCQRCRGVRLPTDAALFAKSSSLDHILRIRYIPP